MAKYFQEADIDEFRDCFMLYAKSGAVKNTEELAVIMRSLGTSPTQMELRQYLRDKNGSLNFAAFLEVIHAHKQKEKAPEDILKGLRAYEKSRKGAIPSTDLRRILTKWGDRLTAREADQFFREGRIPSHGSVRHSELIQLVTTPPSHVRL